MCSPTGISRALCGLLLIHSTAALATGQQHQYRPIQRREAQGERCSSILINDGDTCDTLSAKCGVSAEDLALFNPAITCSTLPKGKPVCCSDGNLSLPPPSVGSRCYSYTLRGGDTCDQIAKGYYMTTADIETYNKETWAWSSCGSLNEGDYICLSSGDPPMPVTIGNAVCGPQVPGTTRPKTWSQVPSLNPCPSGQCCSGKGQCGTGADFCGSSSTASDQATITIVQMAAIEEKSESPKTMSSDTATQLTVSVLPTSTTSTTSEFALIDIPLTFYHPKEEITKISDSTSSATQTTSLAPKTSTIETVHSGWSLSMYTGRYCKGNYMTIQGHNKRLDDSACMVIGSDLGTIVNDTSVSCRWWADDGDGFAWGPCSNSRMQVPSSWIMSNGLCTVVENEVCDNYNYIAQTYGSRGPGDCQNRKDADPWPFKSMQCYVG